MINKQDVIECAKNSKLIKELGYENIQNIIGVKLNEDELKILNEIEQQKSIKKKRIKTPMHTIKISKNTSVMPKQNH